MKRMTSLQIGNLSLLSIGAPILPPGFCGYLDCLLKPYQPQPVATDWLSRLESVWPGVTARYWEIVNT